MVSTLIETININADDFTDNFLTCPTCMGPYDEHEHTPKLLPCSHTLCRACLERIASTAVPQTTGVVTANVGQQNGTVTGAGGNSTPGSAANLAAMGNHNSLSRSVAAADAAAAAINSQTTLTTHHHHHASTLNGGAANPPSQVVIDVCFRCPICRETITVPRAGGVSALPPSFIVNQLLDLVKNQRRDLVPRCTNHSNEELLFCETCDTAFCSICESHCRVISNADHIVIPFSIAIKRMTEIFLFKSNQCINSFNLSMANVQREIERLNETVENVAVTINDSFNELKAVIDRRKEETLKNLTRIKESKVQILTGQMQLIANEKKKVENECNQYNQSQIDCKFLSGQIQKLSEKLDCLRSLCEPRENSFIRFEYQKKNTAKKLEEAVKEFGSFKVSNTYPPLCSAQVVDYNSFNSLSTAANGPSASLLSAQRHQGMSSCSTASTITCSANLGIDVQIQTVDYYGQKRNEGGDPIQVKITDPNNVLTVLNCCNNSIVDGNNGTYTCKLVPSVPGKYLVEVSVFSRPINQMPIQLNVREHIDSLWTFGGGSGNSSSYCGTGGGANLNALINKGLTNNKGCSDRDFNMPISVRSAGNHLYVLDSGNNRIKVLSKQGQFVRHIQHSGLSEASSTAMAVTSLNGVYHLLTVNWRQKQLCDYEISPASDTAAAAAAKLSSHSFIDPVQEPINLCETFHPNVFVIEDKKRIHLCTNRALVLFESLENKMKTECNIKSITSFCCHQTKRRVFIADATASPASIYELDLDWLTDNQLESLIVKHVGRPSPAELDQQQQQEAADDTDRPTSPSRLSSNSFDTDAAAAKFTYRKLSLSRKYPSSSSLASVSSNATISSFGTPSKPTNPVLTGATQPTAKGTYTSLCHDSRTNKLLAARCDKNKTVIEIFNSETGSYEYSIENSANDKALKRVTSMTCTQDGYVACVDLVQNCVKMYRFK